MAGKRGDRWNFVGTSSDGLATVAAVFRRQNVFLLIAVEIAIGPAVIAALMKLDHDFRRQFRALSGRIETRPVLVELIAAMLGYKDAAGVVEIDALGVAKARCKAFRR